MELKFKVRAKIRRPVEEVFQAVQNPDRLREYFTTGGASAPLVEGTTVMWSFADYPGQFPVKVGKVVPNELITFGWEASEGGYDTLVEMRFEPLDKRTTLVTIAESGWKETAKGLESSYSNCEGWTNMACCLKAFLEHGINLREGFY
jgi:uncharacterized protein YndB with AHSA1/START domain